MFDLKGADFINSLLEDSQTKEFSTLDPVVETFEASVDSVESLKGCSRYSKFYTLIKNTVFSQYWAKKKRQGRGLKGFSEKKERQTGLTFFWIPATLVNVKNTKISRRV